MRFRCWTEHSYRILPTLGDGEPLRTEPGDVVIVAVVKGYELASEVMGQLAEMSSIGEASKSPTLSKRGRR
jgi:hypothetical protein